MRFCLFPASCRISGSFAALYNMYSAAEAEIGAIFINAKEGAVLRTTLEELGHPQPPTPMETDKTTPPQVTEMAQLKKNAQKQWICAFIG
jgi:hypothetical protein